MKYDISLCLAGIRPHFWRNLYNSAGHSCTRYKFELVIVSPFDLPEEMKSFGNVKHIKEFGCPTRATQIGVANCQGTVILTPCDDGFFTPGSIDRAMDLWLAKNVNVPMQKNCLVCRYKEGSGFMELGDKAPSFPDSYWRMRHHLNVPNTGIDWHIAPQPMIGLEYLKHIGGFDCESFECMSMCVWDICCRIQRDGTEFFLSPDDMMCANNVGEHGSESEQEKHIGGHSAIYEAQVNHDHPKFMQIQGNPEVVNRVCIDFDNWKSRPDKWERRWK